MQMKEVTYLVAGFFIGSTLLYLQLYVYDENYKTVTESTNYLQRVNDFQEKSHNKVNLFNESLSEFLYKNIKILCMIMTHPENHRKKAIHVQNTWEKRCNKLLFVTSREDLQLDTIILNQEDSRKSLWHKTKEGFLYLHKNYIDEFDWFLKADDDSYVILENLRYMLSQYNPQTSLYFGHRYAKKGLKEGYMAGGGYILSKKALIKFANVLVKDKTRCYINNGAEDYEMGRCLQEEAIFVDCRDGHHQKRFFPLGIKKHLQAEVKEDHWYTQTKYYNVAQGSTDCCSEYPIQFHYVKPTVMYLQDYLIYGVHPFGDDFDFQSNETLPRKLSLEEIIAASDVPSLSPLFVSHQSHHNVE
ncbi:CLUMA_CG001800, isoform A [Clunio marinus]|uniref:N-acetylgalactosaminide beta-1,3-galactosyltransferase n=1 Tax=Clunio marinus TaxID=568069 RepID=A0A1J1HNG6_9DIPT|nr:CLUMA_CG001800, isoform A [Clunio marinus]